MEYHFLLKIFTLLFIIISVQNMTLMLNSKKEVCLNKDLNKDDHLKIVYTVAGDNEYGVNSRLMGPYAMTIFQEHSNNSFEHKYKVENNGTYTLCFQQTKGNNYVSFEFSSQEEGGHVVTIAKEAVFTGMNKNISDISLLFEEIEANIKDHEVRKTVHNNVLSGLIDSIKNYTIYKLLIIVIISLLQIYIIRKYFENKRVSFNLSNPFSNSSI